MSHFSECHECHANFDEGDLIRCFTCDATYCADCTEELGADERTCDCEPLCATCRQAPTKCRKCKADGCMLCMGNGCDVCEHITLEIYRFHLLCDSCRIFCATCEGAACPEHIDTIHELNKATGKRKRKTVCLECVNEAFDDLATKRKAPLVVVNAEKKI